MISLKLQGDSVRGNLVFAGRSVVTTRCHPILSHPSTISPLLIMIMITFEKSVLIISVIIRLSFQLTDALINDIEQFASYAERLRQSLNPSTNANERESICVAVHSALSMVSKAVRDLLVRYPAFKTTHVLLPASQLIHSVKELNFDNSNIDASRTLICLEKLEAAVGNTLKQSLRPRTASRSTLSYKSTHVR
uniref:Rho GTPase-activating protein 29/45 N-terminal domain-containing protein n=1 Tax=Onchocerca volvulus TaxID=6282 RepID=A0A8R1XL33_ONCVO